MLIHLLNESVNDNQRIEISSYDNLNSDYDGFNFKYNDKIIKVRTAKKTPKKSGYFTVIWIKDKNMKNCPYSENDLFDYLAVVINNQDQKGLFLFPKKVLIDKGILSSSKHKGKMGFRVYTPWDTCLNTTARRTYSWQVNYFQNCKDINCNNIDIFNQNQ